MGILVWIIVGLVAGLIARALLPGKQSMGLIATTLLGIVGSLVGGLVGTLVWNRNAGQFSPGGLLLSVAGALLVLFLYTMVIKKRHPARA